MHQFECCLKQFINLLFHQHNPYSINATRNTSSVVVIPCFTFNKPSSIKNTVLLRIAISLKRAVEPPLLITFRISSFKTSTSWIAIRPRYPVILHTAQPEPLITFFNIIPRFAKISISRFVAFISRPQSRHTRRISRWAMTAFNEEVTRNGSTPISNILVIVAIESFVWIVLRTK